MFNDDDLAHFEQVVMSIQIDRTFPAPFAAKLGELLRRLKAAEACFGKTHAEEFAKAYVVWREVAGKDIDE